LFGTFAKTIQTDIAQKILLKNYTIKGYQIAPNQVISFQNTSWDVFTSCKTKKTRLVIESLVQNRFGTSFSYAGEKQITLNGEVSFIRINLMGMNFLLLVFKCSKVFKQGRI
jgi:hypothetical protein